MKHTPGPWRVAVDMRGLNNIPVAGVETDAGYPIANCGSDGITNARLIAAAPDLLAALDQIARLSRDADRLLVDLPAVLGDIARAAIVKARGE